MSKKESQRSVVGRNQRVNKKIILGNRELSTVFNIAESLRLSKAKSTQFWQRGGPFKIKFSGVVNNEKNSREVVGDSGTSDTLLSFPGK